MGSSSDKTTSSPGLTAAIAFFPAHSRRIRDLFESDESFRGVCEDLADAESALKHIAQLPDDVRYSRQLEYRELIASLSDEIEEAIAKANVIQFRRDT